MALELVPPPSDLVPPRGDALQAWAERHHVVDLLDRPLQTFPDGSAILYRHRIFHAFPTPTLRHLLGAEEPSLPSAPWLRGRPLRMLTNEFSALLQRQVAARQASRQVEAANLERWLRSREQAEGRVAPPVLALVDALLRLRPTLRDKAGFLQAQSPFTFRVNLNTQPFGARVVATGRHNTWETWFVELLLEAGPARPTLECQVHKAGGCDHELRALDVLVDFLLGPQRIGGLDAAWVKELARPPWERFLEPPISPVGDGQPTVDIGLLSWRVHPEANPPRLEAVQHKPLKSGGWSKGTRISYEVALRHFAWHSGPGDARALESLTATPSALGPIAERIFLRAVEHLIGHPHVFLVVAERQIVPLHLERGALALSIDRAPDGRLVPTPMLAGSADLAQRALQLVGDDRNRALLLDHPEDTPVARGFVVEIHPSSSELLRSISRLRPEVPASEAPRLMARLAPVEAHLQLRLPPELEGDLVPPDHRPHLRLRLAETIGLEGEPSAQAALELEVVARPLHGGPPVTPGEGPPDLARFEGARRLRTRRDLQAEVVQAEGLLARLPLERADAPQHWQRRLGSLDDALDLVAHLQGLPPHGEEAVSVEWLQSPPRLGREAKPKDLHLRIADQKDWFGLEGGIEIDGEQVELALLLEAARRRARYVQVGPQRWVALSQELRDRLGEAADVVHGSRKHLEVSPAAADALADLLDAAGELRQSARWRTLVKRLATARNRTHRIPKTIRAKLRPYQEEGFAWMMRLAECELGAVLADDMGLGKTLQALALLQARAERGPALVLAPTSVCFNWERETERFAPSLEICRYQGPAAERAILLQDLQPGEVVIASYGLLLEDAEAFQKLRWETLILDEAQAVKNAATQRARAVRDLKAGWSVALTGTPIENHVGELWSLFRVVAPGLLGSWDQFRQRFANPIERRKDPERRAALARLVRPFILRRTKDEVAPELPSRTEVELPVTLSRGERRLYDAARMAALAQLAEGGGDQRFEVLAALTRLRQLACHPRLYDPDSGERSSKLEKLLEVVEELRDEGHRALIFSQFTSHLALVREALDARRIAYRYLDGSTPAATRASEVDAFQRGEGDLFLISLKAGGTGLNLTAANYVIHLDPWWNPAVEDQATDRAHRIGQSKPVTVYRLVAQGTIEESILALHAEKRDLVASLLEGTSRAGKLTTDQLVALIRAGAAESNAELGEAPPEVEAAGG